MALALMTILLHHYNSHLLEKISQPSLLEDDDMVANAYQFGITDKNVEQSLWGAHKSNLYSGSFDETVTQTVQLSENVSQIITLEEIISIVEKALRLSCLAKMIHSKSASTALRYQFIPFMSSVSSLFFSNLGTATSQTKLNGLIDSWNMRKHPVSKNGNCCFVSVALGLQTVNSNTHHYILNLILIAWKH
jgi:hypothetical protein